MAKERHVLKHEIFDVLKGHKYGPHSGYAFLHFRADYYDKIQDPQEKELVRDILMSFLAIDNFSYAFAVAWICDDLEIPGYEDAIKKMIADGTARVTLDPTAFKSFLVQFDIDKALIEELDHMKYESNERTSNAIFDLVVNLYRKIRGDLSKGYASKAQGERSEAEITRKVVQDRLMKLLKSEYRDSSLKTKAAIILSDLRIRAALNEIEKLLQDSKITDSVHVRLLNQALAHLKEQ
jgi:hypothetical protein